LDREFKLKWSVLLAYGIISALGMGVAYTLIFGGAFFRGVLYSLSAYSLILFYWYFTRYSVSNIDSFINSSLKDNVDPSKTSEFLGGIFYSIFNILLFIMLVILFISYGVNHMFR